MRGRHLCIMIVLDLTNCRVTRLTDDPRFLFLPLERYVISSHVLRITNESKRDETFTGLANNQSTSGIDSFSLFLDHIVKRAILARLTAKKITSHRSFRLVRFKLIFLMFKIQFEYSLKYSFRV